MGLWSRDRWRHLAQKVWKGFDQESKGGDESYMLTRGGYRLIEKDEAYFAGKLRKQLLLEVGQDGVPRWTR